MNRNNPEGQVDDRGEGRVEEGMEEDEKAEDGDNYVEEGEEEDDDDDEEEEDDEEEDDDDDDAASLVDPGTIMTLTQPEREWALQIKTAVEQKSKLQNLSDMEYAQYALVTARGNLNEALYRIEAMQGFRKEYKIDESPEQGVHNIEQVMNSNPGYLLNIDICPDTGEGIYAVDLGAFNPTMALTCNPTDTVPEQSWKYHVVCNYYTYRALNPSLQSIREGIFWLFEGSSFGWENCDMTYETRLEQELRYHYPTRNKKAMVYNTNLAITMFWNLLKPIIPQSLRDVLELGCEIEDNDYRRPKRTLSELYLQPDFDVAKFHLLQRTRQLLIQRNENERSFRL